MVDYMCDQKPQHFCKLVEGTILRIVEQPYPLTAKACKKSEFTNASNPYL